MGKQVDTWKDALTLLVQGNQRFTSGLRSAEALAGHTQLKDLAQNGQKPFAIILSCSDSRVPAELVFDCGFGDLFVVRVAGNIVQPSQIASIEYAAKVLGASLCVVMGHSKCGAVQAAVDTVSGKQADLGPNISLLIELIRPAVKEAISKTKGNGDEVLDSCVRQNVRTTAATILEKSSILRSLADEGKFRVSRAHFALETGTVQFEGEEIADMALNQARVAV